MSPPSPVFPLEQEAGELLVGARDLRTLQNEEAGGDVVDVAPGDPIPPDVELAFAANAVFSRETVAALRSCASPARAAVRAGTPLWRTARRLRPPTTADLPLPIWTGPKLDRAALESAALFAVCDEETAERVRVPPHGRPPHVLEIPSVRRLGGEITHWLHALDLSLAALQTDRLRFGNTVRGDVDVHPTAYVSGSILEQGVRVEAHASIVDSYVGRDVLIADHSVIHSCVIGARCRTLVDTSLRRVVAMPDSTLSNLGLNDTIIGRNVFLTTAVATFGPPPGEDADVDEQDTGRPVLGAAIGARAILGARALLKAGVALPAGILVVAKPDEAVGRFDDAGLSKATMIRGKRDHDV